MSVASPGSGSRSRLRLGLLVAAVVVVVAVVLTVVLTRTGRDRWRWSGRADHERHGVADRSAVGQREPVGAQCGTLGHTDHRGTLAQPAAGHHHRGAVGGADEEHDQHPGTAAGEG